MAPLRRLSPVAVAIAVGALLSGCTGNTSDDRGRLSLFPSRAGSPYSTTLDGIRVSLLRPGLISPTPNESAGGFASFPSTGNRDDSVNLMVPSTVCGANKTKAPVPDDYVAYLHSLTAAGLAVKGEDSISIDGVSGTELTLGSAADLPGTIGQSRGAGCTDSASVWASSDRLLRMAIFAVQGKTVLVWASTSSGEPTPGFFRSFQKMLQTVTFG
jgi:hypothetical protein